jgi:MFS family permease
MKIAIKRLWSGGVSVPQEYRHNFLHLYLDVAWWGILNGSIIVFLGVYVSRLGGSTVQMGFLTGVPALVNLLVSIPAGLIIQKFSITTLTRRAALIVRLFYLLLIPLPILFPPQTQIWLIIIITLIMTIPGTLTAVIGNAFLAEMIPPEWRGQVIGTRNALVAGSSMVTALVVGQVLKNLPFSTGYQIVFLIGFLGSMGSLYHLWQVRPYGKDPEAHFDEPKNEPIQKTIPSRLKDLVRFDVVRGNYLKVLVILFTFHIATFLPNPLFPLYQVNQLKFSDQTISLGTSLFWVIHMIASTQGRWISAKLGFKKMFGVGAVSVGIATLFFMFSYQLWVYMICQLFSGIGWSMIGGGMGNYLLEKIPVDDRPAYLTWYNIAINLAVLICGLIAPQMANLVGLQGGMAISVVVRFMAGFMILALR